MTLNKTILLLLLCLTWYVSITYFVSSLRLYIDICVKSIFLYNTFIQWIFYVCLSRFIASLYLSRWGFIRSLSFGINTSRGVLLTLPFLSLYFDDRTTSLRSFHKSFSVWTLILWPYCRCSGVQIFRGHLGHGVLLHFRKAHHSFGTARIGFSPEILGIETTFP